MILDALGLMFKWRHGAVLSIFGILRFCGYIIIGCQYMNILCGDRTILRQHYLHNVIFCSSKTFIISNQGCDLSSRYAADWINRNNSILPGTTIGMYMMDDCKRPGVSIIRLLQSLSHPVEGPMPGAMSLNLTYPVLGILGSTGSTALTVGHAAMVYNVPYIIPLSADDRWDSLNTWRDNNVVITSKRRRFDVITTSYCVMCLLGNSNWLLKIDKTPERNKRTKKNQLKQQQQKQKQKQK